VAKHCPCGHPADHHSVQVPREAIGDTTVHGLAIRRDCRCDNRVTIGSHAGIPPTEEQLANVLLDTVAIGCACRGPPTERNGAATDRVDENGPPRGGRFTFGSNCSCSTVERASRIVALSRVGLAQNGTQP
jgi:hypothetical protein